MSRPQRVLWISATAFWVALFIAMAMGLSSAYAVIEMTSTLLRSQVTVGGLLVACAIVYALTKLPR